MNEYNVLYVLLYNIDNRKIGNYLPNSINKGK
jgi:hypothetical protein